MTGKPVTHRCPTCRTTVGTHAAYGMEDWHWLAVDTGRAGPFCSAECSETWKHWPRDRQLTAIFGGYVQGLKCLHRRRQLPNGFTHIPRYTEASETPKDAITAEESLHWHDLVWRPE